MHHSYIDKFSRQQSPIHNLDARVKLAAIIAYSVVLISFGRYEIAPLIPMTILPFGMLWIGGVPIWFAIRRVILLSPFILMLALMSVFYDRQPHSLSIAGWSFTLSGGVLTAISIAIKFSLGLLTLTAMTCTTQFSLLLEGMGSMAVPRMLIMELSLIYRYIFVLIDEAMRLRRARDFRGAALAGFSRKISAAGNIIGMLFLRTLDRSSRIGTAMQARGFRGRQRNLVRLKLGRADLVFGVAVVIYLFICRFM